MTELSKVVRERLRVKAAAMGVHPDADLLTAFAERSLTERERSGVMEHLTQCGDCRDVVALALPAEVEETVVAKGGVRSNWFRLPALRWAAVAIGITVAVSLGTLEYRSQPLKKLSLISVGKRETVATLTQPASAFEARIGTNPPLPEASQKILAKKSVTAATAYAGPKTAASSYARSSRALMGSAAGVGGDSGTGMGAVAKPSPGLAIADAAKSFSPSTASAQAAAPVPSPMAPPAVSETVEVAAASPQAETEQAELGSSKEVFSRAKPSLDGQTVSGAASAPILGRNESNMQTESPSKAAPRWTLAANGALQRSFDGGTTWQDVNVAPHDSMTTNFAMRVPTSERGKAGESNTDETQAEEARAKETKTGKRKSAFAVAPLFRALAANGAEVWVGGSSGLLYHTVDAGNSWSRVAPSFEGVLLGGDITGIDFSDLQHGRVATSIGEVWTTGNGGQTWLKVK